MSIKIIKEIKVKRFGINWFSRIETYTIESNIPVVSTSNTTDDKYLKDIYGSVSRVLKEVTRINNKVK